jgi:hypothetical protein
VHYKWRTAWPYEGDALNTVYSREIWSEQFVSTTNILALLELQTFAYAHGYKVVVANAFNHRSEGIVNYFKNNVGSLVEKFDWESSYLHNSTHYTSFMQKLVEEDGLLPSNEWPNFYEFYRRRTWPAKYLTNCDGAHPTINGYKIIGEELANFIKKRGYV